MPASKPQVCNACAVSEVPPPDPSMAYVCGIVEVHDDPLFYLCEFHQRMKKTFEEVLRELTPGAPS